MPSRALFKVSGVLRYSVLCLRCTSMLACWKETGTMCIRCMLNERVVSRTITKAVAGHTHIGCLLQNNQVITYIVVTASIVPVSDVAYVTMRTELV